MSASGGYRISVDSVEVVLEGLHAVLYTENGRVLSYHKSFSDFMFHKSRSEEYWCDQAAQHRSLAKTCFHVMKARLKFNIANIPSSFILDRDNHALSAQVARNIPDILQYACRNWHHHLCFDVATDSINNYGLLVGFIQLRAIFWIEAMNLLGSVGQCDEILQTASRWSARVGKWDASVSSTS